VKTILALDLAMTTGFAIRRADGRVESGALKFHPRKGEGSGQRWLKFRHWLVETKNCHAIDEVYFEDCVIRSGPGQTQTARVYGGFVATLEAFCEHHQMPYHPVGIGTWKKHFTGAGNAQKDRTIEVCKMLGYKPRDDNEADALGILHYATGNCPVLTPSPGPKRKVRTNRASGNFYPQPVDGMPF
jgi:Holliday junction resolvasome RuvABC endonuclease subunit